MTERFSKAYSALVNAYFNGTLAAGHCAACAVGNIVADAQGGKIEVTYEGVMDDGKMSCYHEASCSTNNQFWSSVVWAEGDSRQKGWFIHDNMLLKSLTGYDADEMRNIEHTFEMNTVIKLYYYPEFSELEILEDQYKGLSSVVDVLLELDNITPDPSYSAKFREHKKLQTAEEDGQDETTA